jgi:hypothetical protein
MIDEHAVKFAVEYLDRRFANGDHADLVGMLKHVDFFERVVMVREEVQKALNERPSVFMHRVDGRVIFTETFGDREITDEDLERNTQMYHDEFWAEYRQLQNRNK